MTYFKTYDALNGDAVMIRQKVFVEEQGFEEEFDGVDNTATHIVMYADGSPIAVCRFFWDGEKQSYLVGRIAVMKERRGKSAGSAILSEAEKQVKALGGDKLLLAAQVRAKAFYEKQGYNAVGEEFYEEYCPHVWMVKIL